MSTSQIIHVLCPSHKESIKMGPRHVRPFYNTLIDVDNCNLVVPYNRVRHLSQLNILYILYTFYTQFFARNPLRWIPDISDSSRTPSSTQTTATWWSPTTSSSSKSTSHIIHALYLIFHKESIKMGPRHIRPFQNTLIDVDNHNLTYTCFMPNFSQGIH